MTQPQPSTPDAIAKAADLLRGGHLVAFPTETVYGLGCDATDDRAVARVFHAKGRPSFNPLIIHVADARAAETIVTMDARSRMLAEKFWPGPLTLVLPRAKASPVSLLATAGLDTIAVRVPDHPVALDLIRAAGLPIAAPSANRSGEVSPTEAAHVTRSLGDRVAMILDGGPCRIGVESTVLDMTGDVPAILRPGGATAEAIAAVAGPLAAPSADPNRPASPGLLARHYATALPLRLDATTVAADEALLAFGPNPPAGAATTLNLSESANLEEAAANLFRHLRALDRPNCTVIAVMPVPEDGLGRAINDRLRRAAAAHGD